MIILSFDSTAKIASAATLKDGNVLAEYSINNGLTQSELLLPMAEAMLKDLKLDFDDIDAYACSSGPGSFTGVRIGTALIKGLAFGKNIPCIGVSTIEALAENLKGTRGIIAPVMDARRGQYYCGIFEGDGEEITRLTSDMCTSADKLAELITESNPRNLPIYLVGDGYDGARAAMSCLGIVTENTPPLLRLENAASIGRVALRYFEKGDASTDRELSPTYLRLPQAERERLEKLKETENKQ